MWLMRRVGDQLLEIRLRHGAERAVDDVEGAERAEAARTPAPAVAVGQDREVDAQDAVGAHLQQHAGQDHRDRRRRLDVRVGQPGVEREGRDLDREADEEREPERASAKRRARSRAGVRCAISSSMSKVCGSSVEVQRQHRDQHQHGAERACRGRT